MKQWQSGVDLIAVNYHTPTDLQDFLESYRMWMQDTDNHLWVVNVDPSPFDDKVAKDFEILDERITVVSHRENVGYGRAVNDAASRGGFEMIAAFNADVVLTQGVVEDCWQALQWQQEWGVLAPREVDEKNRFTHAGIFGTLDAPEHRAWKALDSGQCSDIREDAVTVTGSAYFIRRDVWDELTECPTYRELYPDVEGAFLPTRHYYEETWCSYHAQAHGYKAVYYGPARLIHKWHKASPVGGWAEQQFKTSQKQFQQMCDHHGIPHD